MPDRLEFVFTDIADIKWSVCSLKWVTCSNDQSCHFGCHQNAIKFEFQSTASILYYDTSSGKKTIICRYNSKKTKLSAVSFFGKRKRKCCIWYFLLQSNSVSNWHSLEKDNKRLNHADEVGGVRIRVFLTYCQCVAQSNVNRSISLLWLFLNAITTLKCT